MTAKIKSLHLLVPASSFWTGSEHALSLKSSPLLPDQLTSIRSLPTWRRKRVCMSSHRLWFPVLLGQLCPVDRHGKQDTDFCNSPWILKLRCKSEVAKSFAYLRRNGRFTLDRGTPSVTSLFNWRMMRQWLTDDKNRRSHRNIRINICLPAASQDFWIVKAGVILANQLDCHGLWIGKLRKICQSRCPPNIKKELTQSIRKRFSSGPKTFSAFRRLLIWSWVVGHSKALSRFSISRRSWLFGSANTVCT